MSKKSIINTIFDRMTEEGLVNLYEACEYYLTLFDTPDWTTGGNSHELESQKMEIGELALIMFGFPTWPETPGPEEMKRLYQEERARQRLRDREIQKAKEKAAYIYLLRNNRNGYTKIGHAVKPLKREETLQSQEPELALIMTWPGTFKDEFTWHEKYSHLRIRGEWFNLSESHIGEIEAAVKALGLSVHKPPFQELSDPYPKEAPKSVQTTGN